MAGKAYDPEENAEAWKKGYFDLPGGDVHTSIGSSQAFEDGKRMRERLEAVHTGGATVKDEPRQTLGEAIGTLFGLAGAVGGFLVGGWLAQQGMNGLLAFGGGIVGGFVAGVFLYMAIQGGVSSVYRSFLWRRGRDERDPRYRDLS